MGGPGGYSPTTVARGVPPLKNFTWALSQPALSLPETNRPREVASRQNHRFSKQSDEAGLEPRILLQGNPRNEDEVKAEPPASYEWCQPKISSFFPVKK